MLILNQGPDENNYLKVGRIYFQKKKFLKKNSHIITIKNLISLLRIVFCSLFDKAINQYRKSQGSFPSGSGPAKEISSTPRYRLS